MEEEGPQSSFMFLVTCNEAFGYSHTETLDSSFILLTGMLRERGYLMNQRAGNFHSGDVSDGEDGEWIEVVDFDTGKTSKEIFIDIVIYY